MLPVFVDEEREVGDHLPGPGPGLQRPHGCCFRTGSYYAEGNCKQDRIEALLVQRKGGVFEVLSKSCGHVRSMRMEESDRAEQHLID